MKEEIKKAIIRLANNEPERLAELVFNAVYSAGYKTEIDNLHKAILEEAGK